MKSHPIVRYLLCLMIGILVSSYINVNNSVIIICLSITIVFSIGTIKIPKLKPLRFFLFLSFLLSGILITKINDESANSNHITKFEGVESYLAKINGSTETKPKTYKTTAKILAVKAKDGWKKATGKTILYFNKEAEQYPKHGEIYLLNAEYREIETPKNPNEFDYASFQKRKNFFTHHFIRKGDFKIVDEDKSFSIYRIAHNLEENTKTTFLKHLTTPSELGVAEALIAGIKSDLDYETKQAYSTAGAVHILAVSGMHVGIIYAIFAWLLGSIFNSKKITFSIILIAILWIYALYTGLSPSVCRATLMFSVFQIGSLWNRDKSTINTLAISALILLAINPNWIFEVGFQLSYLAVLGILVLYSPLNNLFEIENIFLRKLYQISIVSFSAQVFTFPLSIYYFHQFPNYFLLSNPFVAIFAFLIMPLGLALLVLNSVPFIGDIIGQMLHYAIKSLNTFIVFIQQIPASLSSGIEISLLSVIILYVIIYLSIKFFTTKKLNFLKYVSILILFMSLNKIIKILKQNTQNELTFHFIPNGEGISYITGRNATFISTTGLQKDPLTYQFHLKNYYDKSGVNYLKPVISESNLIIENNDFLLQWIKKPSQIEINPKADYILCSNGVINDLGNLKGFPGKIILDGSNKKWIVEKLKQQAKEYNIKLLTLYDTGSQTFKF